MPCEGISKDPGATAFALYFPVTIGFFGATPPRYCVTLLYPIPLNYRRFGTDDPPPFPFFRRSAFFLSIRANFRRLPKEVSRTTLARAPQAEGILRCNGLGRSLLPLVEALAFPALTD